MTVFELLQLVGKHTFFLYYYAFSMLLSILLGQFFLSKTGQQGVWNYFFSLLIYVMGVFGVFSIILFFFQLFTSRLAISLVEILIPFLTMVIGIMIIRRRVNVWLVTGFGSFQVYIFIQFLIVLTCFLLDHYGLVSFSQWPVYLLFLLLVALTIIVQVIVRKTFTK